MSSAADERFASVAQAHLADARVSEGRMFGSRGLKIAGKVFAMLVKDELVVKLPADRVDAIVAARTGRRFDPGHGRPAKEWVALEPGTQLDWLELAEDAREYVRGWR